MHTPVPRGDGLKQKYGVLLETIVPHYGKRTHRCMSQAYLRMAALLRLIIIDWDFSFAG